MGDRPRRTEKARGKAPVGDAPRTSSHRRRANREGHTEAPDDTCVWPRPDGTPFPDLDPRGLTRRDLARIPGFHERAYSSTWGPWSSICYNGLLMMEIEPTRIIDHEILRIMGVHEQVERLLARIGLGTLCTRHYSFYPEAVRQCVASAEVVYEHPSEPRASEGRLVFFYQGRRYEISITRICQIFGFEERVERCSFDAEVLKELKIIWAAIGSGPYTGKSMKNSLVRNPILTIVAKLLSLTLHAKQEAGALRMDELYLLCLGLDRSIFRALGEVPVELDLERVNLGAVFAEVLSEKKFRAIGTIPRAEFISSLLTPIFIDCGLDLSTTECVDTPSSMDASHMRLSHIFQMHGRRGVYHYRDYARTSFYFRLPNSDWANVDDVMRVRFLPPQGLHCTQLGFSIGQAEDVPAEGEHGAAHRASTSRSSHRASSSRAPQFEPYMMPDFESQPRPTTPPPDASPAEHRLHQSRLREHGMDGLLWRAMRHLTRCFRAPRTDEPPAPRGRKRRQRSPAEE